ncbi:MAG: zf-HC2 domain-containing protein [Pyrinomonadaceae bacterium]|nr:zf-HC2 domain-containing protein [Pyrinomonadaceae bacterium]
MCCQEIKEMFDSYLGDELLVETNHEVLRHLENCPACRRELSARRDLRKHLRAAVINAPDVQINPAFAARLQSNLQAAALRPTLLEKIKLNNFFSNPLLLGAAMCFVILIFGGLLQQFYSTVPTDIGRFDQPEKIVVPAQTPAETSLIQAVHIAWQEMTEHAVGDHENCALEYKLAEAPITLNEAAEKYGKYNKNLDKVVIAPLREVFGDKNFDKIELLESHSCVFDGRRFAHVVLRHRTRRVSVLVTDTDLPIENENQILAQTSEKMRVASFRTAHHAVFVVSDLPEAENMTIAKAISPAVSRHIEKTRA